VSGHHGPVITLGDLQGAVCARHDPALWDLDFHHHNRLGGSDCWLCLDAAELCARCPVFDECEKEARRMRESYCVRAGRLWSGGRPRDIRRRT
jgi:hypothetical protein